MAALILLAGLYLGFAAQRPSELKWEPWSPERVVELREQKRPVYAVFTARWCATCQVNEGVLASDAVTSRLLELDAALLKADWTNRDPEITKALASFGRSAVPLHLYYPPDTAEPVVLPELLTQGIVLDALARTE